MKRNEIEGAISASFFQPYEQNHHYPQDNKKKSEFAQIFEAMAHSTAPICTATLAQPQQKYRLLSGRLKGTICQICLTAQGLKIVFICPELASKNYCQRVRPYWQKQLERLGFKLIIEVMDEVIDADNTTA